MLFLADMEVRLPHTIALDGPTGRMTAAAGWSPWRPAHIHLIVSAEGYEPLVTQLFIDTRDYGQVRTDADGHYEFRTVIPGPYTWTATSPARSSQS